MELNLSDFTYDGQLTNGYLSGGLGQLTDQELGISNFRLDRQGIGKKGYEWVGWKNDSSVHNGPIEISFEFDRVYNFTAVQIHGNNLYSKDVRMFRKVEVFFSIGGRYYIDEPVRYEYERDLLFEYDRNVTIPIPRKVGRFVKLRLWFDSRWILISEVGFISGKS